VKTGRSLNSLKLKNISETKQHLSSIILIKHH